MDLRRLAELSLAGQRGARRTGQTFKLSEDRCKMLGITSQDIKRVEAAVFLIEDYAESVLSTLETRPEETS
jgi:hypothetical protein